MFRSSLAILALILLCVAARLSIADKEVGSALERQVRVTVENRNPWTSLEINNDPQEFQFAIVSDRTGGHRANIFSQAVERLNLMQPEFVLSVGDLIEGGNRPKDVLTAQWKEFNAMVGRLKMPFFYAPGNHDAGYVGGDQIWQEKYGRRWYHFVYRNVMFLVLDSEDPPGSGGNHFGAEQLAWAEQVLAQNKSVRWTIVSLHKPVWTRADVEATGWLRIEKALADRPYTVFCGHVHRFQKFVRQGRNYYQLATTGGGSKLRGVEEGEFDHFVWVTMKKDGPVLANIMLNAVLPDNLVPPETNEPGSSRPKLAARQPFQGKAFLDGVPIPGAMIEFTPSGDRENAHGARADGMVQPDGSFRLSTVTANDGVIEGEYKVTATLRRPLFMPDGKPGTNQLPTRYARPTTTPLQATIVKGKNEVTLELHK